MARTRRWPRTPQEEELAAAAGLVRSTQRYLSRRPTKRMAPFHVGWLYRLHKQIFRDVWPWAGTQRKDVFNIGVRVQDIGPMMCALAQDVHVWQHDPIEQAADLHFRAVHIHPFQDGNGRWARLLSSIWLRQKVGWMLDWPSEIRGPGHPLRDRYLDAIEAADRGERGALVDFTAGLTDVSGGG